MTPVAADPRPFDVCGPLPTGVTVLEASAGTGKTFTIAALAARYVADGTPLDQLLLVTFTRMATGELRDRVRERLVSAEQGLERALAGAPASDDAVVRLLADAPDEVVRTRRTRLARALADFDAATIATTHGFCQEVLGGLGVAGDVEPDVTFVEDPTELLEEIVDDLYIRRFHRYRNRPDIDRAQARLIARLAVENPAAHLEPEAAPENSVAAMRFRLAKAVRDEFERRKRQMALMSYDDLLTRLDDTLAGPGGAGATARLRERYRVVLVDEFQDTDPVQWDIMRRAFGTGGRTLVLIGDPKQAIYAFRGADVYAYLEAAGQAGTSATLEVNWRSDQGLVDAYDALLRGARLGHEGIVVRPVRAADANRAPRLRGAPEAAPLRVRVVHRDTPGIHVTPGGFASNATTREHVARDLAADLVALLSSGAQIERRSKRGEELGSEPVSPGHVAVLVRTNRNAALVREALDRAGIPAVINGAGSVFGTPQAQDWLRLLEAIERPTSRLRAGSAALTPFLGWTAEQVATADEVRWEEVHRRLHHWARVLRLRGVASLTEAITLAEGLPERVLRTADGERRLTDLRHVGQLLHAEATAERMGATALTGWLRERIAEADADTSDEERSRRLESDAEAVQVLTIHRSKGLEFPIVYLPFAWEPGWIPDDDVPIFFHDPDADDRRTIDVALEGYDYKRHRERSREEQRGEDLRLLYVALTRARHQAVVWWAGSFDSRNSALGRLLFSRDDQGVVAPAGAATPADAAATERFEQLAARAPGCVSVERSAFGLAAEWSGPLTDPAELGAARFDRALDRGWRRTSYSDISAGTYEARVASEPEEGVVTDEPEPEGAQAAAVSAAAAAAGPDAGDDTDDAGVPLRGTPSLLGELPVGARVGTLVHRTLEAADFAAADLDGELTEHVADMQARSQTDIGEPAVLVAGLNAAIETPLGPLLDGLRLRDVAPADRLDELEFELPLAGGDRPTGRLELGAIAALLDAQLGPDDPLAGYARRLEDPSLRQDARGFLTGSIDLVVRLRAGAVPGDGDRAGGRARFAIVDYKTNWLAGPDEEPTAWHHRPAALAAEMRQAHYGLQALLYTVALHRYLRWRVAGYDPDRDIAGVLYLFLRGMTGARTPTVGGAPCGVWAWRPPGALVEALSDALDRGGQA